MSDFVSKKRAKERTAKERTAKERTDIAVRQYIVVKLMKNIEKIKSGNISEDILSETKTLCEYFGANMDLMLKNVKL